MEHVHAFMYGRMLNSIGIVREDRKNAQYKIISMYGKDNLNKVKFCDAFHYLVSEEASRVRMAKFRSLICYYYMCAGFIARVGGYQDYAKDFYISCACIADRGLKSTGVSDIMNSKPRDCSNEHNDWLEGCSNGSSGGEPHVDPSLYLVSTRKAAAEGGSASTQKNGTVAEGEQALLQLH